MKDKVVVLLSAGLDSSTNLYIADKEDEVVLALTFNYGQRAAVKEIEQSRKIASALMIPHKVVDVPFIKEFGKSALTNSRGNIPQGSDVDIESLSKSIETAKSVWVPNRNGIFLNIAAGFAEAMGAQCIVPGFNREEASTFPDNSYNFMQTVDRALSYSTASKVKVKCYTHHMDKLEIVKTARKLHLPFEEIWPCYLDGEKWCGTCESCLRSARAFRRADMNVSDLFA